MYAVAALSLVKLSSAQDVAVWPTEGWSMSSPEKQGLKSSSFAELTRGIVTGRYGHIDHMLVVKNGFLVINESFSINYVEISRGKRTPLGCGTDACETEAEASDPFNYIHPSTHPYYKGRDVHSLQSVTKSVSATVVGAALHQGLIESLDLSLLSFFGDYDLSKVDARLHSATLKDLLTMRSGIEWHEQDRPLDETNTTVQLEKSADWIQFTLDQPMDAAPGEKWVYNSGGSHLMSGIVKKATGDFIDQFAEKSVFGPLGIRDYHWKKTPKGYPDTEGGLYLKAEDLAKIGYLYLNKGVWEGTRILDAIFAEQAVAVQVERVNGQGRSYGYQWWRVDQDGVEIWAGLGFGEQYLFVLPEYEMIGVINSWNLFDRPQASIYRAFVQALIESAKG